MRIWTSSVDHCESDSFQLPNLYPELDTRDMLLQEHVGVERLTQVLARVILLVYL